MLQRPVALIVCGGFIIVITWFVAYAGWRGRVFTADLIPAASAAIDFERSGKIPEKGCLSSTCAYDPPGTSWLLLPGIAVFRDPRLFEAPGTFILHAITVAGLILMGMLLGTSELGVLAAALYSVGTRGMFFASSLWPRSHPALCVWTLVFLLLYLRTRRSYYFGLAILTFGLGLLVFLEMAPMGIAFLLAIPSVPRTRQIALYSVAGGILALALWMPYLRFERGRDYEDLKRLFLRQSCPAVPISDYKWCSANRFPLYLTVSNRPLVPEAIMSAPVLPGSKLRRFETQMIGNLSPSFAVNWRESGSGTGVIFVASLRSAIFTFGLVTALRRAGWRRLTQPNWQSTQRLLLLAGIGSVLIGGVLQPRFIGLFSRSGTYYNLVGTYSEEALWLGILLLAAWGGLSLRKWSDGAESASPNSIGFQLLIVTYLLAWLFWAVFGGSPRYFYWLWVMQAFIMALGAGIVLAIFCGSCARPWARAVLLAGVVGLNAANGTFISQVSTWVKSSWSGTDDPIIAMLDQIASERKGKSSRTVRVVYETAVRDFVLPFSSLDPIYTPGMEYDFYLREKYGLENEFQCVGAPADAPDYVVRDDARQQRSGVGKFVWYDADSQVTKNMHVVQRRGPIVLLDREHETVPE